MRADVQDEPYKLTTISKDLREVHAISGDFLVQEGQVTFMITDRKGDMRMLDFDPAGKPWIVCTVWVPKADIWQIPNQLTESA